VEWDGTIGIGDQASLDIVVIVIVATERSPGGWHSGIG